MSSYREAVRKDVNALAKDARALVADTGHMAGEKVGAARHRLSVALDSAQEACGHMQQKAIGRVKATDRVVRDHPYQAVGIALGIGALLGFLLTRCKTKTQAVAEFECPQCHEIIVGDESSYDQQVQCPKCQAAMLVPQKPVNAVPQTARLIEESGVAVPGALDESVQETDIFRLFPVARAFLGQIMLGAIGIGLGVFLTIRARDYSWPRWVALIPLTLGLLTLLLVWIQRRSYSYRLTNH